MLRRALIPAILAGMVLVSWSTEGRSQGYVPVAPCSCGVHAPHYHYGPGGSVFHPGSGAAWAGQGAGGSFAGRGGGGYGNGNGAVPPGEAGPIYGLPRGRRYYGGRFFGSFNNRYYGPQYGNF
jgi:hypothetical protein